MNEKNLNNENIKEIEEEISYFKESLFLSSRVSWGFCGAMVMLVFIDENLYLENSIYPYAAKVACAVAFILSCLFDAFFNYTLKSEKEK